MYKLIAAPLLGLAALCVLAVPQRASAETRFGVYLGAPAYAPAPAYSAPYYTQPYTYAAPAYGYSYGYYGQPGWRDDYRWREHREHEWREHERREHREHEWREHHRDRW